MAKPAAGERRIFKQPWMVDRWGRGCTVSENTVTIDRPAHPGRIHRDWVAATTDNGTEIKWQLGQFNRYTKPEPRRD